MQGQQLQQNTNQLSRLYELVAGNGDGRSQAVRLITAEQKIESQRILIVDLTTKVARLTHQQAAWRNQAIGISATVSLFWFVGIVLWNLLTKS